jgi:hypothetical protein
MGSDYQVSTVLSSEKRKMNFQNLPNYSFAQSFPVAFISQSGET